MNKESFFKIERIDEIQGQVIVKFINKYGDIFTNKKTLEDFFVIETYETGSFYANGTPILEERQVLNNNNPNEDVIYAVDIPLDSEGKFVDEDTLLKHIANHYPENEFEINHKRKNAAKNNSNLFSHLEGKDFYIELKQPEPNEEVENLNVAYEVI